MDVGPIKDRCKEGASVHLRSGTGEHLLTQGQIAMANDIMDRFDSGLKDRLVGPSVYFRGLA